MIRTRAVSTSSVYNFRSLSCQAIACLFHPAPGTQLGTYRSQGRMSTRNFPGANELANVVADWKTRVAKRSFLRVVVECPYKMRSITAAENLNGGRKLIDVVMMRLVEWYDAPFDTVSESFRMSCDILHEYPCFMFFDWMVCHQGLRI